jgi:hypothetical protein
MFRSKRQLPVVLASAMAIALLTASTVAEAARKKSAARGGASSTQVQPAYAPRSAFGYQVPQGGHGRYNMPPGGGINFNDGRLGANWSGGAP